MTIANNYQPIKQETNGTTKTFSFDFYALNENYIRVVLETNDVQTVVNPSQYTVEFDENAGSVTFNTAPEAGSYVIIYRQTPQEQETPFKTSSGFPAKTVEGRLDKLTAMVQEVQDSADRSVKFPVGNTKSVEIPLPEAGKALVWKDDESGLRNSDNTFDDIASAAQQAAQTAVASATAAAASETNASNSATVATTASATAQQAATSATTAVSGFDAHVSDKKDEIDTYVQGKEDDLDTYAATKESEIGTVATQATSDFNTNATAKTTAFNTNAAEKQQAINTAAAGASVSAQNAAQSAASAESSATKAERSASSASASATTATQKATSAEQYATNASNYSQSASESATAASTSASNASASATNAAGSATSASNSAATAAQKATEAQTWADGNDEDVEDLGGTHSAMTSASLAYAYANADEDVTIPEFLSNHNIEVVADDVPVNNVTIGGQSIVSNKVAVIPIGSDTTYGVVKTTKEITTLATSGTVSLATNSHNYIAPTGAVTLSLPATIDTTKVNEIELMVNQTSAVGFDFGTILWTDKGEPDMSVGIWDIVLTYHPAGYWLGSYDKWENS